MTCNKIVIHTLLFMKLYLLDYFEKNNKLPIINKEFVNTCLKTMCTDATTGAPPSEKTIKLKEELKTFYNKHYKPLIKDENLSYTNLNTVLDYLSDDIVTMYENNIKLHTNQFFTEEFGKNFGFHIFAMGFRPNDLTSNWKIDDFQRVIIDKKTTTNVFAGGDCINQDYPRNAQVAYQQGAYIANYLNAIADNNTNEQIKPFEFQSNGISLYIGNNKYYTEINTRFGQIRKIIHKSIIEFYYKYM